MRYADADLAAVIGRDRDLQAGQVPCAQLHSSVTLARTGLPASCTAQGRWLRCDDTL
jgi:hypothetical protein